MILRGLSAHSWELFLEGRSRGCPTDRPPRGTQCGHRADTTATLGVLTGCSSGTRRVLTEPLATVHAPLRTQQNKSAQFTTMRAKQQTNKQASTEPPNEAIKQTKKRNDQTTKQQNNQTANRPANKQTQPNNQRANKRTNKSRVPGS